MQNLLKELESILKQEEEFVSGDGKLLKNSVIEAGLRLDSSLLNLLIGNETTKKAFFTEAGTALVFDKIAFQKFVSNKQFLANSYTSFKNKIGLSDGGDGYLRQGNDVVLNWAYKDCVLECGMTKEEKERDEIFYNTILAPDEITRLYAPKVFTNFEKWDAEAIKKGSAKEVTEIKSTDNLLIKGNNLLALHCLKERYAGKVKLIYSDPPYNTPGDANSFTYNNSFNHSTWLTFMKNRLSVARTLLSENGFMVMAIDHCELFYLGVIADEIFGRDNRLGVVTVLTNPRGRQFASFFSVTTDYMLVYAKDKNQAVFNKVAIDENKKASFTEKDERGLYRLENLIRTANIEDKLENDRDNYFYPIYVSPNLDDITLDFKIGYSEALPRDKGRDYSWEVKKSTFRKRHASDEHEYVARKDDKGDVRIFKKYREQQMIVTHWFDKKYNSTFHGTRLLEKLIGKAEAGNASYPKSLYTIIDVLKIMTEGKDVILDTNGGSGTTGQAVLNLNKEDGGDRSFILLEQLEKHVGVTKKRLDRVISSEVYTYCELKEWNERYIQEIFRAKTHADIKKTYEAIKREAFYRYDVDMEGFKTKDFGELSLDEQKEALCKCLDVNHLYVNYSERDDARYNVTEEEKELTKKLYGK